MSLSPWGVVSKSCSPRTASFHLPNEDNVRLVESPALLKRCQHFYFSQECVLFLRYANSFLSRRRCWRMWERLTCYKSRTLQELFASVYLFLITIRHSGKYIVDYSFAQFVLSTNMLDSFHSAGTPGQEIGPRHQNFARHSAVVCLRHHPLARYAWASDCGPPPAVLRQSCTDPSSH